MIVLHLTWTGRTDWLNWSSFLSAIHRMVLYLHVHKIQSCGCISHSSHFKTMTPKEAGKYMYFLVFKAHSRSIGSKLKKKNKTPQQKQKPQSPKSPILIFMTETALKRKWAFKNSLQSFKNIVIQTLSHLILLCMYLQDLFWTRIWWRPEHKQGKYHFPGLLLFGEPIILTGFHILSS